MLPTAAPPVVAPAIGPWDPGSSVRFNHRILEMNWYVDLYICITVYRCYMFVGSVLYLCMYVCVCIYIYLYIGDTGIPYLCLAPQGYSSYPPRPTKATRNLHDPSPRWDPVLCIGRASWSENNREITGKSECPGKSTENHWKITGNHWKMVISHSYISLPEGKSLENDLRGSHVLDKAMIC